MRGEIVWEYVVPDKLRRTDRPAAGLNPGFDVELVPNNNILFLSPGKGIYEIDRKGEIVWSYLDRKISHDADRLPNGNTLVVFGDNDKIDDAQVKEINPDGKIIWSWHAKDHFYKSPYKEIYDQGWTHTNSVTRLSNGNTIISLRNFNCIVEVDPQGDVVRIIESDALSSTHDPEMLASGNILVASQWRDKPHQAIEIDPETGKVVWQHDMPIRRTWPIRDTDRLPNGNTLITGSIVIIEVTPEHEVVWALRLNNVIIEPGQAPVMGFYKAERICQND